jgi:ribosomal protein S18 acetylase RimI-like enzyme
MAPRFTAAVVPPRERLAACRVLTGDFPPEQRALAAGWFRDKFETGEFDTAGFYAAKSRSGAFAAACYVHRDDCSGATVVGYRAERRHDRDAAEDALLSFLNAELKRTGVKVCQLISRPDKVGEYAALLRHGFVTPCTLVEYQCVFTGLEMESVSPELLVTPYSDDDREDFTRVLIDSYEGSSDCPELNGVRTPDETFRSLRGNSREAAPVWFLARSGGDSVGVLLLNPQAPPKNWELTYLGLVTPHRHRGFGRALLTVAMATAARAGAPGMTLTTDTRNPAARRLYETAGFRQCGSYEVFLNTFKG